MSPLCRVDLPCFNIYLRDCISFLSISQRFESFAEFDAKVLLYFLKMSEIKLSYLKIATIVNLLQFFDSQLDLGVDSGRQRSFSSDNLWFVVLRRRFLVLVGFVNHNFIISLEVIFMILLCRDPQRLGLLTRISAWATSCVWINLTQLCFVGSKEVMLQAIVLRNNRLALHSNRSRHSTS
jgi:hypothetical protein